MKINEIVTPDIAVDEKATRKLCKSSTPDSKLGASNLSSCKSQGLRARKTKKTYLDKSSGKRKSAAGKKTSAEVPSKRTG
jgi:hypothetical protein